MTLYYTHKTNLPTTTIAGHLPFPLREIEPVNARMPLEEFPEVEGEFLAAQLLTRRSTLVLGYSITLRLVYLADAMLRRKGEVRINLTEEVIPRLKMIANGTHPFAIDLRDITFHLRNSAL